MTKMIKLLEWVDRIITFRIQNLLQRISTMKSEEHVCKYEDILLHLSEVIAAQDKELSDYRKLRFKLLCASFFDRIKWVFTGIKT